MYIGSNEHRINARNALAKARSVNNIKIQCRFCDHTTNKANIKKHEKHCHLNPTNRKECPVCSKPIKDYKKSATCSYACSNKLFRTGPNNGNWKDDRYQTTCFHYHKKECIICGESNIVTVHHLDENHFNNDPANLIPLCPTHHQYWHSSFRHLVEKQVMDYITAWINTHATRLR